MATIVLTPQTQAFVVIESINELVVHVPAFAFQQYVQLAIPGSHSNRCERFHSLP
jgi:hypothetical protein